MARDGIHGTQARHFLLPDLSRFLDTLSRNQPAYRRGASGARHGPRRLRLHIAGRHADRQPLDPSHRGTFASPGYIKRFGEPQTLDDLENHRIIGLFAPDAAIVSPFVFTDGGKERTITPPSVVTVTGAETNVACACLGRGLIQVPRYRVAPELARGTLVEVLSNNPPTPLPVHVLYSHTRQLSPRVRVVIEWIAERFRIAAV